MGVETDGKNPYPAPMLLPFQFKRAPEHDTPLLQDVKAIWSKEDHPHRWRVLALSATITGLLMWGVSKESTHKKEYIPPEVIWVKFWPKGRTLDDVKRQQAIDGPGEIAEARAERAERQKAMADARKLADAMGIDVDN
jgi:hypothetical protein